MPETPRASDGVEYAEVPEFPTWTSVEAQGSGAELRSEAHEARGRELPSPPEARTWWLEQELKSLQATVERLAGDRKTSAYWGAPVSRTEEPEIRDRGAGETREEQLRSVPITLPLLVSPEASNAALEAGDWLAQLRPLVGDVATSATRWWDDLMTLTYQAYNTWLSLGPLERLHVQAPSVEETSLRQTRLDQRVTMMLMNALPAELKTELIATRQLHTAGVVFKVLRTYQPGGLSEKAATLASLTSTTAAESALELQR